MTYLAVFDWNGTLFDDMEATHIGTNESLAFFGKDPITIEEEQEAFTFPLIHFYEKMGIDVDEYLAHAQEVGNIFLQAYERENIKCGLAEGTLETLDWLRGHGVACKILSNHRQENLLADVKRFGIDHYFEAISGNENPSTLVKGLSKLKRLQSYMEENGYSADKTFIIGDSHEEPELARKTGILGISISGGLLSPRRLEHYKKDYVIDSLSELPAILSREWNLAL